MDAASATGESCFGGRRELLAKFLRMSMAARGARGEGPFDFWGGARHDPRAKFPFGGRFGGRGFGRGRKRKRAQHGDVRAAVLVLLSEQPMHGYQIIQEIGERSEGAWQPSPGSVYPILQQLEDEGLVLIEQTEGRKVVNLTEAGRTYVEENRDELEAAWNAVTDTGDERLLELRNLFGQVATAGMQVAQVGTESQLAEARIVMIEARRRLYLILAEDDTGDEQDVDDADRT